MIWPKKKKFMIWKKKNYVLQLEEFSVQVYYFLMYFYCKILNSNYFEAF